MYGTATVVRADAAVLPLADVSVDLIITSPPYFGLRSYTDGGEHYAGQLGDEPTPAAFVDALLTCTQEWMRVLKPRGSIFVNLGDKYNAYNASRGDGRIQRNEPRQIVTKGAGLDVKGIKNKSLIGTPWRYALRCVDDLGLILRSEIVWAKSNPMPESTRDRVRRSHEQWFHLTKTDRYHFNAEAIRPEGTQPPDSVWTIATESLKVPAHLGAKHYAVFPREWPRRLIHGWAPPSAVVLDPFGGTGTTALVAKALGHRGISADLSADYCRIAQWRVNDPKQLRKV
jgi:DNA modification methylase